MIYFVKYIRDYKNTINYNMAYNKIAYKSFYRWINKKKYEL